MPLFFHCCFHFFYSICSLVFLISFSINVVHYLQPLPTSFIFCSVVPSRTVINIPFPLRVCHIQFSFLFRIVFKIVLFSFAVIKTSSLLALLARLINNTILFDAGIDKELTPRVMVRPRTCKTLEESHAISIAVLFVGDQIIRRRQIATDCL